jgi:hypothetical protein
MTSKNLRSGSKSDNYPASEMNVRELSTAFISVLDNEEVITKLATALSVSINLVFDEKLKPLLSKIDVFSTEIKSLNTRVAAVEGENAKLKQINDGLQASMDNLTAKVNLLEQASRNNCIVLSGVQETYAERTEAAANADESVPMPTREDTLKTVCSVLNTACKVTVQSADIHYAVRLQSKRPGPRPLLVSLHSLALRSTIMKSRPPKQTLSFNGTPIYINDHLTKHNADLFFKSRQLVKQKEAHSAWVRDGRVYIKWSQNSRATHVVSMLDLQ